MQRVLLCCKSIDDARVLKNYIETELPYEVIVSFDQQGLEAAIKAKNIHLIILQTGNLAVQDVAYARNIRGLGFQHPLLMVTDTIGDIKIDEISQKHRIYFLERPFELKTFKGLAKKLMMTKAVPQQSCRRYPTNLSAVLETFISGEQFPTHMFNLSKGGAYFETSQRMAVNVGDLVRLKVHLSDMDREHHVHGRVVWTTHKGHSAGGYGIGLKFMKTTDIYRNLLEKV